jgi:hypothetical protein
LAARAAYDPDGGRRGSNNFTDGGGQTTGCGQANVYRRTISFSSLSTSPAINVNSDILLAVRLKPIYADANIYVNSGGVVLPSQGNLITSTGTTGTGLTRRIVVARQFRSAPSIFDAAVVSQTDFMRN